MAAEPKKSGPWKDMTAEERSAEMKRRRAVADANGKKGKRKKKSTRGSRRGRSDEHASTQEAALDHHVSYLFGKVETIIEYYASSNGLPKQALAEGVAGLLRH